MSDVTSPATHRTSFVLCCLLASFGLAGNAPAAATPPDGLDNYLKQLDLSQGKNREIRQIVTRYRLQEAQIRDAFVETMRQSLTAEQFRDFQKSLDGVPAKPIEVAPQTVADPGTTRVSVVLAGGYDTDPRDRGRPVVLIAAGLNVPADVFRKAFSGVHPAGPGQQPQETDVRQNKRVLLDALGPYGVDDGRLNEVSNYYRYSRSRGQMWWTKPAKVDAVIREGKLTGFVITDPGAGYSSTPTVSVAGFPEAKVAVKLKFGTDLDSNGSIESLAISTD